MEDTGHIVETAARVTKVGAGAAASSPLVNWAVENSEIISLALGFGGFLIGLAGFAVNWYYKHKYSNPRSDK